MTLRSSQFFRLTALLFWAALLFACASPGSRGPTGKDTDQWTQEFLQAHELPQAEQIRRLDQLADEAPTTESARQARFEAARLTLRAGDIDDARRRFQAIVDAGTDNPEGSRSLYELGRLHWDHDDDPDGARRLLHRTITDTPPWAGSEFAMDFLIRRERRAGRLSELTDDLSQLIPRTENDRMAAQLHLARGTLLDELGEDPNRALAEYRSAYQRCPSCSAAEEALFQMGLLYQRYQRWDAALQALEIVANRTQRSFFVGTYHAHRASDSRFEMGLIELVHRQDYPAARSHFRTYLRIFPYGTRADEAAWHLVEIERLHGSDRTYRRALQQFIDDRPRSRYAAVAQRRLQQEAP